MAALAITQDHLLASIADGTLPSRLDMDAVEQLGRGLAKLRNGRTADVISYFLELDWKSLTHHQAFRFQAVLRRRP
ncbi:hypothetical protein ABIB57_002101 [Devosia sp. UYZn731]|uniref:hypothetical protein n=1 Tax=Devosia sp. UYZn731 TaxID=3156345 RepID=UPI003398CAE7